jgi:hypothetical protein
MPIEAPLSRYKKTNFKIYIVVCLIVAVWFGYDGYVSSKFREKHTLDDGTPDSTLIFNRWAPPVFIAAAVLLGVYLSKIRNRKIVADDNGLVISDEDKIPYDSIQKIDKTYFGSKGYFIITHKSKDGGEVNRKLSERNYDNLAAILDHLVAKIS